MILEYLLRSSGSNKSKSFFCSGQLCANSQPSMFFL